MSDPWPPAFMRTAPPTDPGTPTAHDNPDHPASATRRARTGNASAAPAAHDSGRFASLGAPSVDRRQHQRGEAVAEVHHDPVEPRIRHQDVGTPPDDGDRDPRSRGATESATDDIEVGGPLDLEEERGRATDPVRGQRPERVQQRRAVTQSFCQGIQGVARRHHSADSSRSSGSMVRSPAPRVRQRSPARSSAATARRSSSHPAA